jgi:iron complex outermembrane receptor protein
MQHFHNSRRLAALMAGTALSLAAPGLVYAQAAGSAPAARGQTDEIIVTAQKRTERLENVPISITAASGAQLEKSGVNNVQDLAQISVGVNISHLATFIEPTIRGVTSTLVTPGLGNNVGVYVDGYYEATSVAINTDLVSVKSVQLLKGPQGTLFGRNTTAGAILIDTLDPSFTPTGRVGLGYGSFNEITAQGYYSGPIIADKLAFDISAYKKSSDGYIKNINTTGFTGKMAPVDLLDLRGKLMWTPTPQAKFTLIAEYDRDSDPQNSTSAKVAHNDVVAEFAGAGITVVAASRPWESSLSFQQGTVNMVRSLALIGQYDFGFATLKSISHFQQEDMQLIQDSDGTQVNRGRNVSHYKFNYGTQEFNLTHSGPRFDWVAGLFFYRLNNDGNAQVYPSSATTASNFTTFGPGLASPPIIFSPGPTAFSSVYNKAQEDAYAAYADGTWRVTDRLSLIGGVRFSYDNKRETVETFYGLPGTVAIEPWYTDLPNVTPSLSHSWTAFTPRAVVQYKLAPATNVYFSYSQGFKSGGYVGTVPLCSGPLDSLGRPTFFYGNCPLKPEKITAYEAGFKTVHGPFRLSAAAYYDDYKDLQISSTVTLPTGTLQQVAINAATSKIYGIELEGAWRVNDQLNIRGGVAWTHARYDSFKSAPGWLNCPVSAALLATNAALCTDPTMKTGSSLPIPAGNHTSAQVATDVSGLQMLRAPDWTANIAFDYTQPTSMGTVALNGSLSYSSSFPETDLSLLPGTKTYRYLQPAYVMANMQASWTPFDKNVTLTAYVKNLSNSVVYNYYVGTSLADSVVWGAPRTYGVKVDYKF